MGNRGAIERERPIHPFGMAYEATDEAVQAAAPGSCTGEMDRIAPWPLDGFAIIYGAWESPAHRFALNDGPVVERAGHAMVYSARGERI